MEYLIVKKDGKVETTLPVYFGLEEIEYIHKHHSYSYDWACKYEGYSFEHKEDGKPYPIEDRDNFINTALRRNNNRIDKYLVARVNKIYPNTSEEYITKVKFNK